jgi:ATP-dependent RNA helicase DDX51/DBP6
MYSRYVPPKKKQKLSTTSIELPEKAIESAPAVKSSAKPPKESKSKSHSTSTHENTGKRKRTDGSSELKSKGPKKKREHEVEVEAADRDGDGDGDGQGDGDADADAGRRHKSLLEKRDRSLKKAEKLARRAAKEASTTQDAAETSTELHGLGPLPQPEPVPEPAMISTTSTLPAWLASPIRIAPMITASFSDMGIHKDVERSLQKQGFQNAFAVQAAVLPLLLPGPSRQGDVLVEASTGSGKTLSYVLPMIESISQDRISRLRGLIVMPTRELVFQAREVCKVCADAFASSGRKRIKIGTAVGSENFKAEQAALMAQELRYDPKGYRELEKKLNAKWESSEYGSDGEEDVLLCDDEDISPLPGHIIDPISRVDILICTPGRLVEHLKSTPGFTIRDVKWLVVDEADVLLNQSFQQWLGLVMERLGKDVRKVILSATIARDIGQLSGLKLRRPRLVVLESPEEEGIAKEGRALPPLLAESAIKVDDSAIKPLYLLHLLERENMTFSSSKPSQTPKSEESSDDDSDSTSESSSDGSTTKDIIDTPASAPLGTARGVVIFTKSNETAVRLGRLIALLEPKYADLTGTLTSTTRSSTRASTIALFNSNKLSILVASDLVSRGLDLPDLAHVVNYDIPTSVTNYVHRVGRTARAGRAGSAWTLFTDSEGRWFWNEIARSETIQRPSGSRVERVNVNMEQFNNELRGRYDVALEELGREATGPRQT